MRLNDVLQLTGAAKKTLYRWMEKHPAIDTPDPNSALGHPFPRPTGSAGRAVVWDEMDVRAWWSANGKTVGRHPPNAETLVMSWEKFRKAMLEAPLTEANEQGEPVTITDNMLLVQRFERAGDDEVHLWFRNVSDAVFFKLNYG